MIETARGIEFLKNIPVHPDLAKVMTRFRFHHEVTLQEEEAARLLYCATSTTKSKAMYKSSVMREKTGGWLEIDNTPIRNALLKVNLRGLDRVFPYIVTCGDSLTLTDDNFSITSALDIIRKIVLDESVNYLRQHMVERYSLSQLWSLEPGEMQAWPQEDRKLIFYLFGNTKQLIGVTLDGNCTLIPKYSACGIFYPAEVELEACQICPQTPCMGRRAPYNEDLARNPAIKAERPCGRRLPKNTYQ